MTKYQRYESCVESPIYRAIVEAATEALLAHGVFRQIDVLEHANVAVVEDAIRWDYIERMIEKAHSTELVRLNAKYFKRHQRGEELDIPGKFIAINRKQTIGYAIASLENGHLIRHVLKKKQHVAEGHMKSAARTDAIGGRLGIPGMPQAVPGIEKPRDC